MDFDKASRHIWMSAWENPNIYELDLNGNVVFSFPTDLGILNKAIALDGAGGIWVSTVAAEVAPGTRVIQKYSLATGVKIFEYFTDNVPTWAMCTNINNRGEGLFWDGPLVPNPLTGLWESRIQKWVYYP